MEGAFVLKTSYCSEVEGFPYLLRGCALHLGVRKKPKYAWKEYQENGVEKCSMVIYLGESRSYPNHPPFQITAIGNRFPDTCQNTALKALRQLCQNCDKEITETPLCYFPPTNKNSPTWRKRLQSLSGREHNEYDPTVIYMARYLHTLDTHFDDLFSHCTRLTSRVENLEQQIKELKEENAALQNSLEEAEGEEANTCEAYRSLKKDYARRLKRFAPVKKIQKHFKNQGCQTVEEKAEEEPPSPIAALGLDNLSDVEEVSLASLDEILKEFGDVLAGDAQA
jgi:FtsZ-binding cell division protein ZapB